MSANIPPAGSPQNQPPHRSTTGDKVSNALAKPKVALGIIITAAAIWFIIANNVHVRIHLWLTWVTAELWAVLLLTFLAGALVDRLFARHRRRSRR